MAAVVKASTEGLGLKSVLEDLGIAVKVSICSDATAAIGICRRQGLGRVRHLATADLWIQQRVKRGHLALRKWPGPDNPSDLLTKYKAREDIMRMMLMASLQVRQGRAQTAPVRAPLLPDSEGQPHDSDDEESAMGLADLCGT